MTYILFRSGTVPWEISIHPRVNDSQASLVSDAATIINYGDDHSHNCFIQPPGVIKTKDSHTKHSVMQSDGNTLKIDTFREAITSKLII